MAGPLISHPFRVGLQGSVEVRDDLSDVYLAERLVVITCTQPGERVMAPAFGLDDPTYAGFSEQALILQLQQYGVPVNVSAMTVRPQNDTEARVVINFTSSNRSA